MTARALTLLVAAIWFLAALVWLGYAIHGYGSVTALETGVRASIGCLCCFVCGLYLGDVSHRKRNKW